MRPHSTATILFVAILTWCLSVLAKNTVSEPANLRGVAPSDIGLYVPDQKGQWRCLDGSRRINFAAINDDYCDCMDGSDEPGTSACGTQTFFCENKGHLPGKIKSSRVNDGICDPECCDGSDEYDGTVSCPNVCEEADAEARAERERVRLIQMEGSQLRKEYIAYGTTAKTNMEKELADLQEQAKDLERAVDEAKAHLDKVTLSQEQYQEHSKGDQDSGRRIQLSPLIREQTDRLAHAKEARDMLRSTLQNLRANYNKNYHDMGVKDVIVGFKEYTSSHGEVGEETEADADASEDVESEAETSEDAESEATKATIDTDNDDDEDDGYEDASEEEEDFLPSPDDQLNSLLDETGVILRDIGGLYDLLNNLRHDYNKEYNDEAVLASVKVAEDFAQIWHPDLQEFKDEPTIEIPAELTDDSPEAIKFSKDVDDAQAAFDDASVRQKNVQEAIKNIEKKMVMDLGKDQAFAKLLDQCFDYKDIEYTYSICFFGNANQRSHSTTFLGKFSHWEGPNYDTQVYNGGTKCWNGPDRSVKLVLTCGTSNEITSVSEPAKCEYEFRMQTPAVCPILPEDEKPLEDSTSQYVSKSKVPNASSTIAKPKPTQHDEL
ncbi:hypothetical protein BGZ94_009317 [Podila epigama]|nr:hypothetical protein BGZ94_009317 [Podila epigama]